MGKTTRRATTIAHLYQLHGYDGGLKSLSFKMCLRRSTWFHKTVEAHDCRECGNIGDKFSLYFTLHLPFKLDENKHRGHLTRLATNPIARPLVAGIPNVPKTCELETCAESDWNRAIVSFPTLVQSTCPCMYWRACIH